MRTKRAKRATRLSRATPARTSRRTQARRETELVLQSSAYRLKAEHLERGLLTGEHAGLLEDYYGAEGYQELRQLALEASAKSVRGGPRVLILPGIMGSTLGKPGTLFDDVIWVDPIDIARGKLVDLALDSLPSRYQALGAILLAYLKLKLRLKIAGYDADFYPFDWRQSIDEVGKELARHLDQEGRDVNLVAHSMGGLVSRAAIAAGTDKIRRLIMLGTPNFGSFAPVQALRGAYPIVRKVAALDLAHSPEELAERVFNTFPGLYQMLPSPAKFGSVDLYQAETWPPDAPRPRQKILDGVKAVQQSLAKADDRFFLIAGVNQETVIALSLKDGQFVYETSTEGDGTVPLAFAELPDTKTYYVEESHGSLPNNRTVAQAVEDLLSAGKTEVLPAQWSPSRRGAVRQVRDADLRIEMFDGRRGTALSQTEIRHLLDEVAAPEARPAERLAVPVGAAASVEDRGYAHEFDHVVVARRRQHRIDLNLALGSITEVSARAYVLGIFQGVTPSGAAAALDARLDGAITEFTRRRMFSGRVGEVFIMPAGRRALRADLILFVGLGPFDRFDSEVQKLVGEHVIRTLVRTNVEEFATVVPGAGSGFSAASSMQSLMAGFIQGLLSADLDQKFRCITLCEINPERYSEMKRELYRLSSTALLEAVEVTFDEITLPPPLEPPAVRRFAAGSQQAYLIVRQETVPHGGLGFRASVLGAGDKATIITGVKDVDEKDLSKQLMTIESSRFTFDGLAGFGDRLAKLVLTEEVLSLLRKLRDYHLVVVHDAPSSRVPWETIYFDEGAGWFPAAEAGLSRKYTAENLSIAKWLEERQQGPTLDILLVVNPTQDLDGAEVEGNRVKELFKSHPAVKIEELHGSAATKAALLAAFRSGSYDAIHYAGHAFFDPSVPSRSGILCHGRQVLSGADLAGVGNLPSLVFFNACEAGRVRGAETVNKRKDANKRIEEAVGMAEAFLRGGIANYVGTYWPVGDDPAKSFAETFYTALLAGKSIGEALSAGRKAVRDLKSVDWADYIHYGAYDFALKSGV